LLRARLRHRPVAVAELVRFADESLRLPRFSAGQYVCARVLLILVLAGCTTTVNVTPTIEGTAACEVRGTISYEGNREYLPGALVADSEPAPAVVFRYTFDAQYGLKAVPVGAQLVNPLNFVGFPTGTDSVVITGRLEVVRGGSIIRTYGSAAAMQRSGTMFSEGETFTEMRHRGLLLVRDNISRQICRDQAVLAQLGNPPAAAGSAEYH